MLLWGGAAALVAALAMGGLSTELLGHDAPGPVRLLAEPGQVAVVGGDTLRLGDEVVRLSGVEAPEWGDRCQDGRDCGGAATAALAGLVHDRRVECELSGRDRMGRRYAACAAGGLDLSGAIVASGWARAAQDRPRLAGLEREARERRAGLWAGGAGN